MADTTTGSTTRTARLTFFCVSGPLPADRPGYIERDLDAVLKQALSEGRVVNIVGAPMSGKTSALLRAAATLRESEDGPLVAFIDTRQLAERDGNHDIARWFYAIAYRIVRQLRAGIDLQTWWADNAMLPPHLRLVELYRELLLGFPSRSIALLFDDLHLLNKHADGDALLASFRAMYDARASDPSLNRLSVGFTSDGSGQFHFRDAARMPFSIAQDCIVDNLTLSQTFKLSPALGLPREQAELVMQRIFDWVSGHPALTQALAADFAARNANDDSVLDAVDQLVQRRFANAARGAGHPALSAIQQRIIDVPVALRESMLLALGFVAKRGRVLFNAESEAHDRLLSLGALRLAPDGYLVAGSRLLRRFLNAAWANRHLPTRLSGLLKAAAVLVACVALPLWYRILLPKPYVATLMAEDSDVPTLINTADHLSIWPGYGQHADRILYERLSRIAGKATTLAALDDVNGPLLAAGGRDAWVQEWSVDYWQRRLHATAAQGDRAGAIASVLGLLSLEDSVTLRRRLAALVGSDLEALSGVLRAPEPFDALRYRRLDGALITRSKLRLDEWMPGQSRGDWLLQRSLLPQALQVTPAVITFSQPARTNARSVSLQLRVAHERPTDLSLLLTTPDGRTGRIALQGADTKTGRIELSLQDIPGLRETLRNVPAGDWTLSVADARPGMRGSIESVSLGGTAPIADAVVSVPDPHVTPPASVHLTPGGRFAIALPAQTDGLGAIWDLRRRSLIASVSVSANARLLGFGDNARHVFFIDGVALSGFRLGDGEALSRGAFDAPVRDGWLSSSGRWLAALTVDEQAQLQVFDLEQDRRVATLAVGDDVRQLAVSEDGAVVAVAGSDHVVRVWRTASGNAVASLDVGQAVRDVAFIDAGEQIIVRGTSGGMLAWSYTNEDEPTRWDSSVAWSVAHDQQSGLSLVGSRRDGYRVHDFSERRDRALPFFGFSSSDESASLLRLRDNMAVVAAPDEGRATIWRPKLAAVPTGQQRVTAAWLSPDGNHIAFTDGDLGYRVMRTDAGVGELDVLDEDVALVRHATAPRIVRFSDAQRVLSVESNGLFRVYDGRASRFQSYRGRAGNGVSDAAFDASGEHIAMARGRSLLLFSVATGALIARHDGDADVATIASLPEAGQWMIFYRDGDVTTVQFDSPGSPQLQVSRLLRVSLQATQAISSSRGITAVVAGNALQILNHRTAELNGLPIIFNTPLSEVTFSKSGRYLVVRAGQWLHRLRVDALGPHIISSRLLPVDMATHTGVALLDEHAMGIRLLAGLDEPEPRDIWFDHRDQTPLNGDVDALVARWQIVNALRVTER
ncbi:MAG: WD40 repeat domain-containing protein [Pseudomonadota bacterium]